MSLPKANPDGTYNKEDLEKMLCGVPRAKRKAAMSDDGPADTKPVHNTGKRKDKEPQIVKIFNLDSKHTVQDAVRQFMNKESFKVISHDEDINNTLGGTAGELSNQYDKFRYGNPVTGIVKNGRSELIKKWGIDEVGVYMIRFQTTVPATMLDEITPLPEDETDPHRGDIFQDYMIKKIFSHESLGIGQFTKNLAIKENWNQIWEILAARVNIITDAEELLEFNPNGVFKYGMIPVAQDNETQNAQSRDFLKNSFHKIYLCSTPPQPTEYAKIANERLNPESYDTKDEFDLKVMTLYDFAEWNKMENSVLDNMNYNPPVTSSEPRPIQSSALIYKQSNEYRNQNDGEYETGSQSTGRRKFVNRAAHSWNTQSKYIKPTSNDGYWDFTQNNARMGLVCFEPFIGVYHQLARKPPLPRRLADRKWPGQIPVTGGTYKWDDPQLWYCQSEFSKDPVIILDLMCAGEGISPENYTLLSGLDGNTGFTYQEGYATANVEWNVSGNSPTSWSRYYGKTTSVSHVPYGDHPPTHNLKLHTVRDIGLNTKVSKMQLKGPYYDQQIYSAHKSTVLSMAHALKTKNLTVSQRRGISEQLHHIDKYTRHLGDHQSPEEILDPELKRSRQKVEHETTVVHACICKMSKSLEHALLANSAEIDLLTKKLLTLDAIHADRDNHVPAHHGIEEPSDAIDEDQ